MSLEQEIAALREALKPIPELVEQNRNMKAQLDTIEQMFQKPLSIADCCELLKCSRTTFWKYRDRLTVIGGTPAHPMFERSEVLKLWVNPTQVSSHQK